MPGPCCDCKIVTGRQVTFFEYGVGIVQKYECLTCRQKRVEKQVEEGWRSPDMLLPENLPENRGSSRNYPVPQRNFYDDV